MNICEVFLSFKAQSNLIILEKKNTLRLNIYGFPSPQRYLVKHKIAILQGIMLASRFL